MKIPIKLLSQFIDLNCDIREILDTLPKIGFEIESVIYGDKFVIAQITGIKKHENSDKLKICEVYYFDSNSNIEKRLEVICGANNVRLDLKTVLALEGAIIPYNKLEIKHCKIAGIKSYGMLCSAKELCISSEDSGIIELDCSSTVGESFFDNVIEISVTPNRGDCLGIIGIARELSAKGLGVLKIFDKINSNYQNSDQNSNSSNSNIIFDRVDGSLAGSFIKIKGLSINRKTPKIIEEFLLNSGISTTNNPIINIANYVTLIFNQPMHAYDATKVCGNKIIFTTYKNNANIKTPRFKALNKEEYLIEENDIIVLDGENNIIALAGIIGSDSTKCDEKTDSIILESAHFNHISIANTGRRLSIKSDARYRFERGIDISMNVYALKFCAHLLVQNFGGEILDIVYSLNEKIMSQYDYVNSTYHINNKNDSFFTSCTQFNKIINNIHVKQIEEFLGYKISFYEIYNILVSLGFYIFKDVSRGQIAKPNEHTIESFSVTVPFWRNDIDSFMDIIEEIARINGYDKIPMSPPNFVTSNLIQDFEFETKRKVRSLLINFGLQEVLNWSFICSEVSFVEKNDDFIIANPVNKNFDLMRPTILFGLLNCIKHNAGYQNKDLALFEYGPVYRNFKEKGINCVAGIFSGNIISRNIYEPTKTADFFYVKSIVENILKALHFESYTITTSELPKYFHPKRSATIMIGKKIVGYLGELHPKINKNKSVFFEIFLDYLPKIKAKKFNMNFSRYPFVKRDFAFIFDIQPVYQELKSAILSLNKTNKNIIKSIDLFDRYKIDNKISIAFELELQSELHTLSNEEIEKVSNNIIELVKKNFQGILRKDYVT